MEPTPQNNKEHTTGSVRVDDPSATKSALNIPVGEQPNKGPDAPLKQIEEKVDRKSVV